MAAESRRRSSAIPNCRNTCNKQGRNLLVYTAQAISRDLKNAGWVVPSGVPIRVATKLQHGEIAQVRFVPKATHFVVEVVYEREPGATARRSHAHRQYRCGGEQFSAITSNKPGFVPLLVNGRPLKSLNQSYNKRRAKRQARFARRPVYLAYSGRDGRCPSPRHHFLSAYRQPRHHQSAGARRHWDAGDWQECRMEATVNMGKRNNQAFVFLPHARFIEMLIYKAELVGIQVVLTEESYTSKASFLDGDPLPVYGASGRPKPARTRQLRYLAGSGSSVACIVRRMDAISTRM